MWWTSQPASQPAYRPAGIWATGYPAGLPASRYTGQQLIWATNRVASAANVEFHARIISQKYIQRELIRISTEIIADAYDETTDVFALLDKAESGLFGFT